MALTKSSPDTGQSWLSAHARYAAYAAAALGYSFRSLDGEDGYLFEVADGSRRALFAAGAGSPYALNDVRAASLARDKAFCAAVLADAGLPTIPGRVFFVTEQWREMRAPGREPEDARSFARGARYPLFCKPIAGSNGLFAEVIPNYSAFEDYLARVSTLHFAILAQPFVRGVEHRVFVLEGRALFSYRKHPPHVVGDGRAAIGELARRLPREHAPPLVSARDEAGEHVPLDLVPPVGVRIILDGPANRAAGGSATGLSEGAPGPLARLALAAAEALGLGLAAVDIFDTSSAGDLSDLAIIEANSNPMIKTLEEYGRWDLILAIWRANIAAALR